MCVYLLFCHDDMLEFSFSSIKFERAGAIFDFALYLMHMYNMSYVFGYFIIIISFLIYTIFQLNRILIK